MKKRLISLLLVLAFSPLIYACGGEGSPSEVTNNTISSVVYLDFEQYAPDFEQLKPMDSFGAVNVNDNPAYVRSGKYSAQLLPQGSYKLDTRPTLFIPFYSVRFNYNHKLADMEEIAFELYNAESETLALYAGFSFAKDGGAKSIPETFNIKPGWNSIKMKTNLDILQLSYKIDECYGLYLNFDNFVYGKELDTVISPKIYMDDVIIKKYDSPYKINNLMVLKKGEICDFERVYQEFVVIAPPQRAGSIRVVDEAAANGVNPSSGRRMFELVTKPSDRADEWNAFYFVDSLIQTVNYNQYIDVLDDYEVVLDIYNASDTKFSFLVQLIWDKWNPQGAGVGGWKWETLATVMPGEWMPVSVSLSTLYALNNLSITKGSVINIAWNSYKGAEMTFYFDNFRIQKII